MELLAKEGHKEELLLLLLQKITTKICPFRLPLPANIVHQKDSLLPLNSKKGSKILLGKLGQEKMYYFCNEDFL